MITNRNYNMNLFFDPFKDFFNMLALFVGVTATFFGDFPSFSYSLLRSNIASTFFVEITTDITDQWNNIAYLEKRIFISFIVIFLVFFIIVMYNTNYAQKIIND